jgi:protein gp37
MKFSSIALAFPDMPPVDFAKLVKSIRDDGLLEPILVYDGEIVDGRHRFLACERAQVKQKYTKLSGSHEKMRRIVLARNDARRHMTTSQRAMAAAKLAELERGNPGPRNSKGKFESSPKPPRGGFGESTQADLAKDFKTSERSVNRARIVIKRGGAALVKKVERGEVTVAQAAREVRAQDRSPGTARLAKSSNVYSPKAWAHLSGDRQEEIIEAGFAAPKATMNKQTDTSIDWAKHSWNPVTGCLHACPYCYARDIAQTLYPEKFAPTFRPDRLNAPYRVQVPTEARTDIAYKNIFTCSMADLFGRWVPKEWIEAVLRAAKDNPQWNFLMLTKFPKRYVEFTFPKNVWVGTTVDCQARVVAAEKALADVNASVRWLSIEPMLEPLKFSRLDLFQWLVIGGASASGKTPEWRVPTSWWAPLQVEAEQLGLKVYHKTNLYQRDLQFPGRKGGSAMAAPASFQYLKKKTRSEIILGEAV